MPDIGWFELFIIALVTIIVVGPKEIPRVLRTVSLWVRKIKGMARDFQSSLDDLAREADLDDFRKELANAKEIDLPRNIEEMVDPTGEYARSMEDVENSVESSLTEEPQTAPDAKPADTQESDLGTGHETPAKTAGA